MLRCLAALVAGQLLFKGPGEGEAAFRHEPAIRTHLDDLVGDFLWRTDDMDWAGRCNCVADPHVCDVRVGIVALHN